MHAFLITHKNKTKASDKVTEIIKRENITKSFEYCLEKIEDSRELKKTVRYRFSEKTAIIIPDFDKATEETANSFLKNLEEPNENLVYILTATNITKVLPTIISRCQVVNLNSSRQNVPNTQESEKIKDFLNKNIDQQIKYLDTLKEREVAISFLENLIIHERQKNNYQKMGNYLLTLKNIKQNGNVILQLTNLVVRMNSDV